MQKTRFKRHVSKDTFKRHVFKMDILDLCDLAAFDFSTFSNLVSEAELNDENQIMHNVCTLCGKAMFISHLTYVCDCGKIGEIAESCYDDNDETVGSSIKMMSGNRHRTYYNINSDYSKTQKKNINIQLIKKHNNATIPISPQVIKKVAELYNSIQKTVIETETGQKKFVRRGEIKNEVLAALIYYQCINDNFSRKKKDIACFMELSTNGFSRGESIVRNLVSNGKLNIVLDQNPMIDFLNRYFERLELDDNYKDFVIRIIEHSENLKIGMDSHISSKVSGTIWLLIDALKLDIKISVVEIAADNTKKNTFVKFYKCVLQKMDVFREIFEVCEIPMIVPKKTKFGY